MSSGPADSDRNSVAAADCDSSSTGYTQTGNPCALGNAEARDADA